MHEMSTVVRFVSAALEEAEKRGITEIESITVDVGEMTDIVPDYLYRYYPAAVKGTQLEGSRLVVRTVPVKAKCAACGTVFHPERANDYRCPACGSAQAKLIEGKGTVLRAIAVRTTAP